MTYDFDKVYDRRGTLSLKYDGCQRIFGSSDVIPLWVADMDFPTAQPIIDAVQRRAAEGIWGYAEHPASYFESLCDWQRRRNNWVISPEQCSIALGVVQAIASLMQLYTKPGDGILLTSPVYSCFFEIIEANERKVVESRMLEGADGRWQIDFTDFEEKLKDVKMFLLCSPHNPLGIVWTREELAKMVELCNKHGVMLISDEIHSDLVFNGPHIPTASINEEAARSVITCVAASKTFNLAGLQASVTIFPDKAIQEKYEDFWNRLEFGRNNLFAVIAAEAAYRDGEEWLEQLKTYLAENFRFVRDYCAEHLPGITTRIPDATYLMWLDCRGLGMTQQELGDFFINKAHIALTNGIGYCPGLEGFMRLNVACPRSILQKGMEQLTEALASL